MEGDAGIGGGSSIGRCHARACRRGVPVSSRGIVPLMVPVQGSRHCSPSVPDRRDRARLGPPAPRVRNSLERHLEGRHWRAAVDPGRFPMGRRCSPTHRPCSRSPGSAGISRLPLGTRLSRKQRFRHHHIALHLGGSPACRTGTPGIESLQRDSSASARALPSCCNRCDRRP